MKNRATPKSDPLVGEHGEPTFYEISIRPGEKGRHRLEFKGVTGYVVLTETHSVDSLVERIKGLKLDTYTERSNKAHQARRQIAFLNSLPPRAMG
jgi:hypothetical protein